MNKQELIEKYQQIYGVSNNTDFGLDPFSRGEDAGSSRCSFEIVEDLKKLDEPQKVKVPDEFDTWYKEIKTRWVNEPSARHFALWKICQYGFGCGFEDVNGNRTSNTLSDWVSDHKEDAINAVWNGYEVEEEPKWVVKRKDNGKYVESLALGKGIGFIAETTALAKEDGYKFNAIERADAVAVLINGEVEKV